MSLICKHSTTIKSKKDSALVSVPFGSGTKTWGSVEAIFGRAVFWNSDKH